MTDLKFSETKSLLEAAVPLVAPAAQICVIHMGKVVLTSHFGSATPTTLFDLASVTKLFAATVVMKFVERQQLKLDQPVSSVLPAFSGLRPVLPYEDPLQSGKMIPPDPSLAGRSFDASIITFRHLLSHSSGLAAWKPLFQQGSREAAYEMALTCPFFSEPGTRVLYSDINLILVGLALQQLAGQPLDQLVRREVTSPLSLHATTYNPGSPELSAPTEQCLWRQRRIQGQVHDENAFSLGGISAHAGLFSTATELAQFGHSFLAGNLLQPASVQEMSRLQASEGSVRRGIGFLLWSGDAGSPTAPLSRSTYGHTGFTGTSLFIDPERQLVVALLTNRVFHGRDPAGIGKLRRAVHTAVLADLGLAEA